MPTIEAIAEDFEFLDDWEDRYRYLIELGRDMPAMPQEAMNDDNKVRGCVSQVWLVSETDRSDPPRLKFLGASDAHIVSGLVAVALALFSGRTAPEILDADAEATFDSPRPQGASDAAALQRPALHGLPHQGRRAKGDGRGLTAPRARGPLQVSRSAPASTQPTVGR